MQDVIVSLLEGNERREMNKGGSICCDEKKKKKISMIKKKQGGEAFSRGGHATETHRTPLVEGMLRTPGLCCVL